MRLYSEMDLVAAESLRSGLWDELSAAELAAALSVLVYEARRADDSAPPRLPGGRVKDVIAAMVKVWADLDALERYHHLDFRASPTSASPGRPTAGPRATTWTTYSPWWTWPPATSSAG
jgi:ATP-dependent RNA helicase HelY